MKLESEVKKQKQGRLLLKFPLLIILTVIYLVLGFTYRTWHPSWIMFTIAPFYYHYAFSLAYPKYKKYLLGVILLTVATFIYIFIGLQYKIWHPTWIIYLITVSIIWFIYVFKNTTSK